MPNRLPSYFHLHLISDATGETLTTMAKAAAVQYSQVRPIEHVHPLVRTAKQLERVLNEVEQAPGIVLYTVVKKELIEEIERRCRDLKVPSLHVSEADHERVRNPTSERRRRRWSPASILSTQTISAASTRSTSPWPMTTASCRRISTRPTSSSSASRAHRRRRPASIWRSVATRPPICRWCRASTCRAALTEPHSAFVVGLVASPERIAEIRRNRVRLLSDRNLDDYVDRTQIANEITHSRRLCARHGWPIIDVTRRSIEETAASIIRLLHDRQETGQAGPDGTEDE